VLLNANEAAMTKHTAWQSIITANKTTRKQKNELYN